jgi:hypothetical protein
MEIVSQVAQKPGTWVKHVYGVQGEIRLMSTLNAHVSVAQSSGTATPPAETGNKWARAGIP